MHPDLELALALADAADRLSLPRFRARDLVVEAKPDLTPVTDADRAVEQALRDLLAAERPGDAVLGEEYGPGAAAVSRRWLLDPIDGTRNFTRGIPVWATLIALEDAGGPAVAVVSAPALGRRWWATRSGGAVRDGEPIRVSEVERLEDASFSYSPGRRSVELTVDVVRRVWHARGFGDFWQHMLVAEGALDAALDAVVEPWDVAAPMLIVAEAGGRATDLSGERRIDGGSLVSTNGLLHEEVLRNLGAARRRRRQDGGLDPPSV